MTNWAVVVPTLLLLLLLLLLPRQRCQHPCACLAGFGNLGTLVFAIAFTGGILAKTTQDVWRVVGWLMLDGAAASATVAFVGFWVLTTSAREVGHRAKWCDEACCPRHGPLASPQQRRPAVYVVIYTDFRQ